MTRWWNKRRFDLVEMTLVCVVIAFAAYSLPRPTASLDDEAAPLEAAYGPDRVSENEEEWIIRDFFKDRREGVFVDVGAAHYRSNSNTYYLENTLGWSGLAIEPLRHFEAGFTTGRPRTRFLPFFVSDVSDESVQMYTFGENFAASSSDREFVERFGTDPEEVLVPTITLNDLLAAERIDRFDFLSIDIELSEPKALAGFDVERFRPALVCIEAHPEVRQQILDYFAGHGYVVVGKYLRADDKNLYFTPREHPSLAKTS